MVVEKTKEIDNMMQMQVDLEIASFVLRSGGTILYPTETVWGLGCDATDEDAVDSIFGLKQTTDSKALIVLVDGFSMIKKYVKSFPEKAQEILKNTNKPTTLIYPGAKDLAPRIIAEDGSIGIRITTNPFCLELLKRVKKPIVSTSANISGEITPQKFSDIFIDLIYNCDYVVRCGQDDDSVNEPSRIIKLLENGETIIIR